MIFPHKSNRKRFFIPVFIFATAALSLVCSGKKSPSKNILSVAISSDAKTLDPQGGLDTYSDHCNKLIYEPLLLWNEDKNILEPFLAESYTKIDSITYEFKLRKNVRFHNGEPLTSRDVKYTFERAQSPDRANVGYLVKNLNLKGFKIIDDHTFRLKLFKQNPGFLMKLSSYNLSIINEKAVLNAGKGYSQNPIGTGMYKFVNWQRGNKIEFTRFEEYWGEKPRIQNIVIRIIVEGSNRSNELEKGDIDISYDVTSNDFSRIAKHKDLVLLRCPDFSVEFLGFNCKKKPFDDIRVRQAFAYAIDMNKAVKESWTNIGKTPSGFFPPTLMYANPDITPYQYNPSKAKQLLAEAGYPQGFKIESWTNERQERITMAHTMRSMLKEVGIEIVVKELEWSAYVEKTGKGEHQTYQMGWIITTADPDNLLEPLFNSKNIGPAGNRAFYSNPRLDALIEKGPSLEEGDEKRKVYYEIQKIIMEDVPYLPTYNGEQVVGIRKEVKGFKISPSGVHHLNKVYFD